MKTAALVLASGLSRRFGQEDKLLANLKGQALLAYCLDAAKGARFDGYFIVTPAPDPRAALGLEFGFNVITNLEPKKGQGASIALGAQHILSEGFDAACILLGDMPFISSEFLLSLIATAQSHDIVFSQINEQKQPPAIFRRPAFDLLLNLKGDQGAGQLDLSEHNIGLLPLPQKLSADFDVADDFMAFNKN